MIFRRLLLYILLIQSHYGFCQHESLVRIFVLNRELNTSIRITESSIKRFSGVDSLSVDDSAINEEFIRLLSDSSAFKVRTDISRIDVRMLVELMYQNKIIKISLTYFNFISVNDIFLEYDVSNFINVLKGYIPPDLNWFEATNEEIDRYRKERFDRLIHSAPNSSKSKKKRRRS